MLLLTVRKQKKVNIYPIKETHLNLFIETSSDELSKDEKPAAAEGLELKRKVGLLSAVGLRR